MEKVLGNEKVTQILKRFLEPFLDDVQKQQNDNHIELKNENDLARYRIETSFSDFK